MFSPLEEHLAGVEQSIFRKEASLAAVERCVFSLDVSVAGVKQSIFRKDVCLAAVNGTIFRKDGSVSKCNCTICPKEPSFDGGKNSKCRKYSVFNTVEKTNFREDRLLEKLETSIYQRAPHREAPAKSSSPKEVHPGKWKAVSPPKKGPFAGVDRTLLPKGGGLGSLSASRSSQRWPAESARAWTVDAMRATIRIEAGQHVLRLEAESEGFRLDWLEIIAATAECTPAK